MSKIKFEAFYNCNAANTSRVSLGKFDNKEIAARKCYDEARNHGATYECDSWENVREALMERDFYVVGYGPVELAIEEVTV